MFPVGALWDFRQVEELKTALKDFFAKRKTIYSENANARTWVTFWTW